MRSPDRSAPMWLKASTCNVYVVLALSPVSVAEVVLGGTLTLTSARPLAEATTRKPSSVVARSVHSNCRDDCEIARRFKAAGEVGGVLVVCTRTWAVAVPPEAESTWMTAGGVCVKI